MSCLPLRSIIEENDYAAPFALEISIREMPFVVVDQLRIKLVKLL